jgi:hypothetical protein
LLVAALGHSLDSHDLAFFYGQREAISLSGKDIPDYYACNGGEC